MEWTEIGNFLLCKSRENFLALDFLLERGGGAVASVCVLVAVLAFSCLLGTRGRQEEREGQRMPAPAQPITCASGCTGAFE